MATGRLLLIAGHETTVNLITNGMLTLLRHPDVLDRLRHEPELAIPLVEELLRYEPPVQLDPKYTTLDDVEVGGRHHPEGLAPRSSRWPPPTETRTASPIPTGSTPTGRTTSTSASSPASTTASAPASPARRRRSR